MPFTLQETEEAIGPSPEEAVSMAMGPAAGLFRVPFAVVGPSL